MDTRDKSELPAKPDESGTRPEYIQLVKEAILDLDDPNGSTIKAITEHIMANHWVEGVPEELVRAALSEGVESGTLDQVHNSHYKVFHQLLEL